jgi:hypothetical protein
LVFPFFLLAEERVPCFFLSLFFKGVCLVAFSCTIGLF